MMNTELGIQNAAIRTMDPACPTAEALAIADGGITFVMNRAPLGLGLSDERLTFNDTLDVYTSGGAYAAFKDDLLGRIAPGFCADIVKFDRELTQSNAGQTQADLPIWGGTITQKISA